MVELNLAACMRKLVVILNAMVRCKEPPPVATIREFTLHLCQSRATERTPPDNILRGRGLPGAERP